MNDKLLKKALMSELAKRTTKAKDYMASGLSKMKESLREIYSKYKSSYGGKARKKQPQVLKKIKDKLRTTKPSK